MSASSGPSKAAAEPAEFPFEPTWLDDLPAMVWASSPRQGIVYVNKARVAFTGRTLERERKARWGAEIHPDDREGVQAVCDAAIAQSQPFEVECRLRRRDGVYRWVLSRAQPTRDARGEPIGYIGFGVDVTDRREADAVNDEMVEQMRLLGLATRDMVWSWDARADRVLHNAAFGEMLGEIPGPREATVAWWRARVHPDDIARVIGAFSSAVDEGRGDTAYEYRLRRRDGSWAIVDDRVWLERDVSGGVVRVLGTMRDITARKQAEAAQERFTRIFESTSDLVGLADADRTILYLNRAGRKLLGWPLEGPLSHRHITEAHPAWANEIILHEGIPTATREGTWTGEHALLTSSGAEIPISQVLIAHPGPDGSLEFVSTIMRDISDRKREEVTRIEWANRYDAAIRASGQLLYDWDSFTNDVAYAGDIERLLGYTVGEMAGGMDRFREIIHPEDLAAFDEEIIRVSSTRDPFRLHFRAHRKDGAEIAIDSKGYFFLDRQGRIGRMVGFLADVTAQQEAQQELALAHENLELRVAERTAELAGANAVIRDRAQQQETVAHLGQRALAGAALETLFDQASSLVLTTLKVDLCSVLELTPQGSEFMVRGAAGWPPGAVGRRVPTEYDSQSGYTLIVREPVIVETMQAETRFRISQPVRESGAVSGVSVMVQAGHRPKGVICAMTRQRRHFTQDDVNFLQSIANVLTAAIDRHEAEVNVRLAREQAETANRAKNDFLSRMSHELRTPLNAILGFTQLLEIDTPTPLQSESVGHISRAGHHLLHLINEVLDIASIEAGRLALAPESIAIPEFVSGALELLRPLAVRHGVELVLDPVECGTRHVFADRQRLQQVVLNLLSNAVKYNRPGGSVVVSCEIVPGNGEPPQALTASGGERLRISVRDTGYGLPPEKMARLFIPFERLGAEATEIEGAGIGLALSQSIATALGGKLGVRSVVGEGSTFWIELPAVEGAPPAPAVAEPDSPRLAPAPGVARVILYVEDQDLNLRLVERIFMTRSEYQLLSAMQGGLALDLAREHRPDLILLDLNLPDISGEEVLRRLKADPELCQIPVIMVSADAMGERVRQLLALGATGYLTKPYRLAEFFRVIEEALAG